MEFNMNTLIEIRFLGTFFMIILKVKKTVKWDRQRGNNGAGINMLYYDHKRQNITNEK